MRLALFEPDIPQNTGAMLRLAACLGIAVDIIEPCGFLFDDKRLRRAGMDYLDAADITRHPSWATFNEGLASSRRLGRTGRLLLVSRHAPVPHTAIVYHPDDVLLLGRETAGLPDEVHAVADVRLRVPIRPGLRSLNVATAAAIVLGEALRQLGSFPEAAGPP